MAQSAIPMIGEEHYRKLERMYLAAPINEFFKPDITIGKGTAEITVHVDDRRFFHAANAIHGSVYFKCLDDAAFFAVSSLVEDCFVLTSNFNLYLHAPVSGGSDPQRGNGSAGRWLVISGRVSAVQPARRRDRPRKRNVCKEQDQAGAGAGLSLRRASHARGQFNKIIQGVYPCREK